MAIVDLFLLALSIAAAYLFAGFVVAVLIVGPWAARLPPHVVQRMLGDIEGVPLRTHDEIEAARHAFVLSTIPWWPRYALIIVTARRP